MEYVLKNKTHITAEIWEPDGHRVGYLIRDAESRWHTFNLTNDYTGLKPSKHLETVMKRFIEYQEKNPG